MTVTAAVRAVTVVEGYGANRGGDQRRFTVAAGTDIPKGTILTLSDPRTGAACVATGDLFAGITAMDKEGDDPSTEISTWQNGIYEFTASLAILVGNKVKTALPGQYVMATTDSDNTSSLSIIVGTALKTVAAGERVQVRVNN